MEVWDGTEPYARFNTRRWRRNNPDKVREQQARRKDRINSDPIRRSKKAIAVSNRNARAGGYAPIVAAPEEMASTLGRQECKCAICGAPDGESRKDRLRPDHDHSSGKFRGWICNTCNFALGVFEKNQSGFLEYLSKEQ